MRRRRQTVDLLEEHPARCIDARLSAIDQRARDRSRHFRAIRFNVWNPGDELPVAARQVCRGRAVHEDDAGAD